MKTLFYALSAQLLLLGCTKRESVQKSNNPSQFIAQARLYFEDSVSGRMQGSVSSNPRIKAPKSIEWERSTVISTSKGMMVVAPVQYSKKLLLSSNINRNVLYDISDITKIIFYKNQSGNFICEQITSLPDSCSLTSAASFKGLIQVESWSGNWVKSFKYNANGTIYKRSGGLVDTTRTAMVTGGQEVVTPEMLLVTSYVVYGYNYSEDDPDDGYYWEETVGSTVEYLPDGEDMASPSSSDYSSAASISGGGAGSPASSSPAQTILVTNGPNIIGNIADYLKCFTNYGGSDHSYSVTICVNQPDPGSREPWSFSDGISGTIDASNPVNTGHAFLVLTEVYGGNTITRNVGFYPSSLVMPGTPSSPGQLNDNEETGYNISLNIKVDNAQFFNMLNFISGKANTNYNLYSFNCTTFVLYTLTAGSITLPSTTGNWVGGAGYDPGDLGEDIRYMALDNNMTRNTTYNDHPNIGTCN